MFYEQSVNYMLWYGFSNANKVSSHVQTLNKKRNRLHLLQFSPEITSVKSHTLTTLKQISLTSMFDFIGVRCVINPQYTMLIYFYNETYFVNLLLSFNLKVRNFDVSTSSFLFDNYSLFPQWLLYLRRFSTLLLRFTAPHFLKLRFRGKGYYLYKNFRYVITPQFGYSHRRYFYAYLASVIFLTKTKIIVFGRSTLQVIQLSNALNTIRPINIFTGRGMRFARQVVYRKVGKISTYR